MPLLLLAAAAEACVCCFAELLLSMLRESDAPPTAPQHPAYNVTSHRTKTLNNKVYKTLNKTQKCKTGFLQTMIEKDALDGPAAVHSHRYHCDSYEVNLARAFMARHELLLACMKCNIIHMQQMSHQQYLTQARSLKPST